MERGGWVYIMTNKIYTTLYTGVTGDLITRIYQHKTKLYHNSFTSKYSVNKLVYYSGFKSIEETIEKEKQIKAGSRKNKETLINTINDNWIDLYPEILKW